MRQTEDIFIQPDLTRGGSGAITSLIADLEHRFLIFNFWRFICFTPKSASDAPKLKDLHLVNLSIVHQSEFLDFCKI